ncbi:MAG: hypothetical protein ACRDT6_24600, partial [Micromonosporaceae bacterium]
APDFAAELPAQDTRVGAMTIGHRAGPAPAAPADPLPRTPLGPLAGLAMALAPVLVVLGGLVGGAGWLPVGLGLAGMVLLVVAAFVIHVLRSAFTDEIAEQPNPAVSLGDVWTRRLYYALLGGAYLTLGGLALLVPWTALAFVTVLLLGFPIRHVATGAISDHLTQVVRDTALVSLQYGGLVGLGLALG